MCENENWMTSDSVDTKCTMMMLPKIAKTSACVCKWFYQITRSSPQPMNLIEWIKFNVNYHNYVIFLEFFILSTREQLHFLKVSPECWWTKHSDCCWFHMKMQRIPCGNAVLQATLFKSDESVSHFQSFLSVSGIFSMSFNLIQQKEKKKKKGKQNNIAHYFAMS